MIKDPSEQTHNPRKNALVVAAVLALLAAWNWYQHRFGMSVGLASAAGLLAIIGAFLPSAAAVFNKAWMGVAAVLGYVNARIILSMVFFVFMWPMGLVRRLCGGDPLRRRGERQQSYWIPREAARQTRKGFEQSF